MGTGEFNAGGNPRMDWHPIQGGVEIPSLHATETGVKRRPDGPLGPNADFTSRHVRTDVSFSEQGITEMIQ